MSISKTILVGTLGKDPVTGQTQSGVEYANFSLATSEKWKDKNGEKKEETSWHNISCFGSLAKVCQYLEKGSKIYLEGRIKYETYSDKTTGEDKQATKIMASVIDIIKGKAKDSNSMNQDKQNSYITETNSDDEIPF